MASVAELDIDGEGALQSLYYKGTEHLISAEEVASCVKFFSLKVVEDEDGMPITQAKPIPNKVPGLRVNVIAGPTGSGKSSLIRILGGGMETDPQTASDTKCPTVYMIQCPLGNPYAFLDTAGLCDTEATARKDVGVQELLINAVAATIRKHDLTIVSFLMCVDGSGRLPGNFPEVWPQMHIGLGGDKLSGLCCFVLTKINGGTAVDDAKIKRLPQTLLYKDLDASPLRWPVRHMGRGNLKGIREVIQTVSTTVAGVGALDVDPEAVSLATKQRILRECEQVVAELKAQQLSAITTAQDWQESLNKSYKALGQMEGRLKGLEGAWCSEKAKASLREQIEKNEAELEQMEQSFKGSTASVTECAKQLAAWTSKVEKQIEDIGRMYKLKSYFDGFVGAVGAAIARL